MSTCLACGTSAGDKDHFCRQCGRPLLQGSEPTAASAGDPLGDWIDFTCPYDTFAIRYPPDWRPLDPPASEGAALSCAGPGDYKLLEVFSYYRSEPVSPASPDLPSITAEGIVETLGTEDGHSNPKLWRRDDVTFPGVAHAVRIVGSYSDRGLETTTDYLLIGDHYHEVMLALKVLSPDYAATLPLYEQIITTLRPLW